MYRFGDRRAGSTDATTLAVALQRLGDRRVEDRRIVPTGFDPLDRTLLGGLHDRDLVLLGGLPGVGKTVAALQIARNAAVDGVHVTYVCYEHDVDDLLTRLLLLELGEEVRREPALAAPIEVVRDRIADTMMRGAPLGALADAAGPATPGLRSAIERLESYAHRLGLVAASGGDTTVERIDALLEEGDEGPGLLVVDYLQKVCVQPEPDDESSKVRRVTEHLKDLAMRRRVATLALVAADRASLDARRLRLHHLRGSSALAYEADGIVILNDKARAVSRVHLSYDPVRAGTFRDWVVWSVEKNRRGSADVHLEFRKAFTFYRFEVEGRHVTDRLVDERLDVD